MMFRALCIVFSLFFAASATAQILQPAKLSSALSKADAKAGEEIELIITATIDEGWYVYSVGFDPECGPIPFSITLDKSDSYEAVGVLRAINDKKKHDDIFDCDVIIFEHKAEFRQSIKVLKDNPSIKGTFEGQACSEKEGKCIPLDGDITVASTSSSGTTPKQSDEASAKGIGG